ncbi:MAG: hypothetical protein R6U89_01770 [Dehalococcoidia bacterium]
MKRRTADGGVRYTPGSTQQGDIVLPAVIQVILLNKIRRHPGEYQGCHKGVPGSTGRKEGRPITLSVPDHKEVAIGDFREPVKQMG